jgi:hypothetical protein
MSRRLSRYVSCAKAKQRYSSQHEKRKPLVVAVIPIDARPTLPWRHVGYQLGEHRSARQHAAFCVRKPDGRFSRDNRALQKISLRSDTQSMSFVTNELQRFASTMTGYY